MIIRIVQMTFRVDGIVPFQQLFAERKLRIRHFEGCRHLELWQDARDQRIFFTYSHWDSEAALDRYRFSAFFKDTWSLTKTLFETSPQAWSVGNHTIVE